MWYTTSDSVYGPASSLLDAHGLAFRPLMRLDRVLLVPDGDGVRLIPLRWDEGYWTVVLAIG